LVGFLVAATLSMCCCRAASVPRPAEGARRVEAEGAEDIQPLFVFAVIGDAHIGLGGPDSRYIKAVDRGPKLLSCYVRDINARVPRVDFAVLLGDITDKGRKTEFETARRIVDSLRCPWYAVVGNHDNFTSDDKLGWKNFSGRDSTTYAFDFLGLHFIVMDCTENPYTVDGVNCSAGLRDWVARDLILNRDGPVIVFSHYNMWERPWNPEFDTTRHYAEYRGMRETRSVLTEAGNVVAVINGHVHANRVEVHDGIYYIDVGATLVGRPSVRYFSVFDDRIEVTYAYLSDCDLVNYVADLAKKCTTCFDREEVADFADGLDSDKQFTIPLR